MKRNYISEKKLLDNIIGTTHSGYISQIGKMIYDWSYMTIQYYVDSERYPIYTRDRQMAAYIKVRTKEGYHFCNTQKEKRNNTHPEVLRMQYKDTGSTTQPDPRQRKCMSPGMNWKRLQNIPVCL